MQGLSPRNLKYMRAFAAAWPARAIVQRVVAQIPWRQNKMVPFDPAFMGQMTLYLSAADDLLRQPDDKPTIGLLLCRSKDRIVVEYALRDMKKPIGAPEWKTKMTTALPKRLKGSLPTVEEIEEELRATE